MTMVSQHKGFNTVYYFASSVQLMTWVLLHVIAFHPFLDCDGVCNGYHRYLWDFLHHIYSGDNWCGGWQLMWPFRFVAVSVCGRSGLWPFRFVVVPVCGRSGLWPFRFVAVPVCGRSGLWPFRLWPFRFVAVMTCYPPMGKLWRELCAKTDRVIKKFVGTRSWVMMW